MPRGLWLEESVVTSVRTIRNPSFGWMSQNLETNKGFPSVQLRARSSVLGICIPLVLECCYQRSLERHCQGIYLAAR